MSSRRRSKTQDSGVALSQSRDLAPALSRGIRILELLAESPRSLSLTEIAGKLRVAKSSAFGLCTTLLSANLVERAPNGTYRIGLRLVDLANTRLGSSDLAEEFHQTWDALDVFRREAVILSIRDGTDVIYIACRNSPLPLGVTFRVGMRLPASCTATGKAHLSTLSDPEIRRLYRGKELARLTKKSVATIRDLLCQLDNARRYGYSIDDGETREHMCSFGAPIFDHQSGHSIAGVALSFFKEDLTIAIRTQAIDVVQRFSAALSRRMGAVSCDIK